MAPRVGTWGYADWATQGDNYASPIMGYAAVVHDNTKKLDPLYWILGKKKYQKIQDLIAKDHTEWTNKQLEPISEFHRQNLDPIAGLSSDDSIPKYAQKKSGDAIALSIGGYFGGAALGGMGGMGGGSGGGTGSMPSWVNWAQQPPGLLSNNQQRQPPRRTSAYGPVWRTPYGILGY